MLRFIWWALLSLGVFSQVPQLSNVTAPPFGEGCFTLKPSMLGNLNALTSSGLVAQSLLAVAMNRDQSSIYHTSQYPLVQIVDAVRTCESLAVFGHLYNTASFLVSYLCKGVACEQAAISTNSKAYIHLFSFVCERGPNLYRTWDFVPGYSVFVNRTTKNSISSPVTATSGQCTLCITGSKEPGFDPVTGCLGTLGS